MIKSGFCPVQNKETQIEVEYKSYSSLDTSNVSAVKYMRKCDFAKTTGGCPIECPLYKKAPQNI